MAPPSRKALKPIFKVPSSPTHSVTPIHAVPHRAERAPLSFRSRSEFQLPTELLLEILSYLNDDKPALRSSSTVCQTWLSCARYFLFPVTFSITERNVVTLFTLLAAPCSTLESYIQHLSLDARSCEFLSATGGTHIDISGTLTYWLPPALDMAACLACLAPSGRGILRSLVVRDIGALAESDSFHAMSMHLRKFHALTQLELVRCRVSSLSELFVALGTRPTLKSIAIIDLILVEELEDGDTDSDSETTHSSFPLHLMHLTLETQQQTAILRRLLTQHSGVPSLRSLSLGGIGQTSADRMVTNTFLKVLGGSLKSIKMYLNKWKEVTLAYNTNLQTLSIRRYPIATDSPPLFPSIGDFLSLFTQLAAGVRLLHLSMQFLIRHGTLMDLPWKMIGDSLRDPKFAKLRRLRVQCLGHSGEEMEQAVINSFPEYFTRRGVLKVRYDTEELEESATP